jgi:hypothetical protein
MAPRAVSGEQQLALAVLSSAWSDWIDRRGGAKVRAELRELLVDDGGGIWADWLGIHRDLVREAAAQHSPEPRIYELAFTCAGCEEAVTIRRPYQAPPPKYCEPCRAVHWPRSVSAEAARLARVHTTRWPEMRERR